MVTIYGICTSYNNLGRKKIGTTKIVREKVKRKESCKDNKNMFVLYMNSSLKFLLPLFQATTFK